MNSFIKFPTLFAVSVSVLGCATSQLVPIDVKAARTEVCKVTSEQEITALFERWNKSLETGDPGKVVANYAERSILLPTMSNKLRVTSAEKEEYFRHFLENRPSGRIDLRSIELGCNTAVDAGLYTFAFSRTGEVVNGRYSFTYRWDGKQWLITSHHSSVMPEKKIAEDAPLTKKEQEGYPSAGRGRASKPSSGGAGSRP